MNTPRNKGASAVEALAAGALAVGAVAVGMVAVGRFVVGRLRLNDASIGTPAVDELRVRFIKVDSLEDIEKPPR